MPVIRDSNPWLQSVPVICDDLIMLLNVFDTGSTTGSCYTHGGVTIPIRLGLVSWLGLGQVLELGLGLGLRFGLGLGLWLGYDKVRVSYLCV